MGRRAHSARRRQKSNPRGTLQVNPEGFGFVSTAEGEYFVSANRMNGAFDGDLVEIAPFAIHGHDGGPKLPHTSKSRPQAKVVQVIGRAHETIVGRYEKAEPFGVVVPEDPRILHDVFTMAKDNPEIPDGAIVRVRISSYPQRGCACTGMIEEVLGYAEDDVLVDLIVARHNLETEFSPASLNAAEAAKVDVPSALDDGYQDIRGRMMMTIDPEDARDFDDALSFDCVKLPTGRKAWRLGVHIADVSRYVGWNGSIDLDARRRATSVYLVDRVIPMLPPRLSDDLCSLRPGEDRLSLTVDMFLDQHARLIDASIYPAVIRSRRRFSYGEVQGILDSHPLCADGLAEKGLALAPEWGELDEGEAAIANRLAALGAFAQLRQGEAQARGALDFDNPEAKVRLDASGAPLGVVLRRKSVATSLVEEAMILANACVASCLEEGSHACIYRIHEKPLGDSLGALATVFQEFKWFSRIDKEAFSCASPKAIQAVLRESRGREEEGLVHSLVLRAMQRAVYRPVNEGHFGLALESYAHFTSPIRRYPDLMVHRLLKHFLGVSGFAKADKAMLDQLTWISEHSSKMERVAETAARQSQECKIIELMQRQVGMRATGVISGVGAYGLYVQLANTAEGFVDVRTLGQEYFAFDAARYTLTGSESGRAYRLGQRVEVKVKAAEPRTRTLSFALLD